MQIAILSFFHYFTPMFKKRESVFEVEEGKFFSPKLLKPEILNSKKILIVGDVIHSRVARSNLWALTAFGANVILCGPPTLIPEEFTDFVSSSPPNQLRDPISSRGSITISSSLEESIKCADAVIVLRLQKERMIERETGRLTGGKITPKSAPAFLMVD